MSPHARPDQARGAWSADPGAVLQEAARPTPRHRRRRSSRRSGSSSGIPKGWRSSVGSDRRRAA
eukprot:scaffold1784_cov364-Prasinococcus_capsulatus_cf.AAC.6